MSARDGRVLTVDDYVDRAVASAPSWDELPVESRNTLLRIFRNVELPSAESRSA